jgi:hypothetical protein
MSIKEVDKAVDLVAERQEEWEKEKGFAEGREVKKE